MVLRPKFPGEETGKFSTAEQRIDLPHQGKLLRDQRKKQPTEERERDPWPICLDATPLQKLQPITYDTIFRREPQLAHWRYDPKERLNKSWNLGKGAMAICSVSRKRVYWAALMPYWAAARLPA